MWDEITCPFLNLNCATVEVKEWISNSIPHFTGHVKNNRALLQCYFKLCASFHSHWCIQTWVRVRITDITACDNNSIRSKIVSLKYTRPCSAGFWERKFDVDFHLKIWNIPFKCSKETRLQCLQWKILHNIYPTNIMLSKMKLRDSNKCLYCPTETDFIEHFFYNCAKCVPLWRHVECVLSFLLEHRVNLDVKRVLFGILDLEGFHSQEINVINLCILVAKMCISKYKYGKPYSITLMFDTEMKLRLKHLPYIYKELY